MPRRTACSAWTSGRDQTSLRRSMYAETFSAYAYAHVWEAFLWNRDDKATAFDHPLPADALAVLEKGFRRLPTTYGWATNQGCDAVHRFDGPGQVAVAVKQSVAVWTVAAAPSATLLDTIAHAVGASLHPSRPAPPGQY